ncbi:TPA: tyrosine-type recombinase/integrase [Burkholderia vietnamiensis]|uniref:Tyr recombinase domain-containing protein n=1 Tax=Burkholderia vietnamiensis TaxID=60552 RepID=A0AA45BF90_BURVI|nr:tyrosine-type recombinase/integrase [Burkholderia vietnamiensis]KVS04088.1 hypothetical protein WK32_15610 [Burkholderia vietnamiensis]MCA8206214.1 tyrosine-type recombinase/integrase [Burkholderia vietnamiensis]PRH42536.1 hypothetical protein C6T65_09700 [Burkholderia vietnamiensis]HDR9099037.1 tyrosine-type recombinase/integrase [Burkholderia vietnamiensis]HDR9121255.1 tyrosine-type recombinase/integrase [Burkholderia vietnamiensis]
MTKLQGGYLTLKTDAVKSTEFSNTHTFASRLVQKGVSLLKVSLLLGHANPAMTQKYAHLCPDSTGREAVDILNSLHAD